MYLDLENLNIVALIDPLKQMLIHFDIYNSDENYNLKLFTIDLSSNKLVVNSLRILRILNMADKAVVAQRLTKQSKLDGYGFDTTCGMNGLYP